MKRFSIILSAFCCCVLFMGAGVSRAPVQAPLSVDQSDSGGFAGAGTAIGLAILVVILLRGWRIGMRTRKKFAENERKAYSYKPRGERAERTAQVARMPRAALEDMDFPSGFGGIHNMEQLERNRALYKLYTENLDEEDGWDDERR